MVALLLMSVNRRICKSCGKDKPSSMFPSAGIKKGKKYLRRVCQPCYQKSKNQRRYFNRDWILEYKEQLSCEKCGYSKKTHSNFSTHALDFHHHNNDKEYAVSDMIHRGFSVDKIKKEISKCMVLCSRCHQELHSKKS